MTLVTRLGIEAKPWRYDSQLPPIPWKSDVFKTFSARSLVIGVIPDDGVVKVHPPIARVFSETVAKLQEAGHEIVAWDASLHSRCIAIMVSFA
jgi:amidase